MLSQDKYGCFKTSYIDICINNFTLNKLVLKFYENKLTEKMGKTKTEFS